MNFDMTMFKFDLNMLDERLNKVFDSCPLQEMLLAYARAFQGFAWFGDNLMELPALIQAEIMNLPAKIHAALEAQIQQTIAKMNEYAGTSLPIPELTWDWVVSELADTPPGVVFGLFFYMFGKAPTQEALWNIKSVVAAMYSTEFNPLAWIGEYAAWRNGEDFDGYVRIPEAAPEDMFYGILPWAYNLLWLQLVYTWEPIWWGVTKRISVQMESMGAKSPFAA